MAAGRVPPWKSWNRIQPPREKETAWHSAGFARMPRRARSLPRVDFRSGVSTMIVTASIYPLTFPACQRLSRPGELGAYLLHPGEPRRWRRSTPRITVSGLMSRRRGPRRPPSGADPGHPLRALHRGSHRLWVPYVAERTGYAWRRAGKSGDGALTKLDKAGAVSQPRRCFDWRDRGLAAVVMVQAQHERRRAEVGPDAAGR